MGLSGIPRTIERIHEGVNGQQIRSMAPLSWGNYLSAKRKIPESLGPAYGVTPIDYTGTPYGYCGISNSACSSSFSVCATLAIIAEVSGADSHQNC